MTENDFTTMTDLASRAMGGSVMYVNDELFAEGANLIKPDSAIFSSETFGHKGKTYDGWETRRRRSAGNDFAIIRLGAPGRIHGVVIDTAWFKGNYPSEASVEAASFGGYPTPRELSGAQWDTIVERSPIKGHYPNEFEVTSLNHYTHVRLSIYPDGGVARFRVHGEVIPDPRILTTTFDLAAEENGGTVTDCSDKFYSSPVNLIKPGKAPTMGHGWENARRRGTGNDWVEFELAAAGTIEMAELDTSFFVGNAPAEMALHGRDARVGGEWVELLERTRVQPDTAHRIPLYDSPEVTHVRLDVYPDGGLARMRLFGQISDDTRDGLAVRWFNSLTEAHAAAAALWAGLSRAEAQKLTAERPLASGAQLPMRLKR